MPEITFKRLPADGCKSAYEVFADGQSIGFAWSVRTFSYRGTQGWNRGVRIRDYHPTEWRAAKTLGEGRCITHQSRRDVVMELYRMGRRPKGAVG